MGMQCQSNFYENAMFSENMKPHREQ